MAVSPPAKKSGICQPPRPVTLRTLARSLSLSSISPYSPVCHVGFRVGILVLLCSTVRERSLIASPYKLSFSCFSSFSPFLPTAAPQCKRLRISQERRPCEEGIIYSGTWEGRCTRVLWSSCYFVIGSKTFALRCWFQPRRLSAST